MFFYHLYYGVEFREILGEEIEEIVKNLNEIVEEPGVFQVSYVYYLVIEG
jgi:hypothetical protein